MGWKKGDLQRKQHVQKPRIREDVISENYKYFSMVGELAPQEE